MPDLYAISLISTVLCLCAWMTFDKKWRISSLFRNLFFISFLIYIVFFYFGQSGLMNSMITLFRDLTFIGATASIFYLLRKNIFVSAFFLLSFAFSTPVIYDYLKKDKPIEPEQVTQQVSSISDEWELLVELFPEKTISSLESIIKKYKLKISPAFDPMQGETTDLDDYYSVGIPDENEALLTQIIEELKKVKSVEWIEPNEVIRVEPLEADVQKRKITAPIVNDPMVVNQWAYSPMQLNLYYNYIQAQKLIPQKKTKLYILDTGVDAKHEDLKDYYISYNTKSDRDDMGHGTHCAGIAAGVTNNNKGIASLVPDNSFVEITGIKVLSSFGGTQKTVIDGMIKAIDAGADVLSMSLGGRTTQTRQKAYNEAVKYATDRGVIVIVAAGNSNQDASTFSPANSENVIAVAAVNANLQKAFFSNTLENIRYGISAPGKDIYSTYPNNNYKVFSGTSMAAPMVSGLVAMMKSIDPQMDVAKAYRILSSTGVDTADPNLTNKIIQPYQAIKLLNEEMMN